MRIEFLKNFKIELIIVRTCGIWVNLNKTKYDILFQLYFIIVNVMLLLYNVMKFNDTLQFNNLEDIVKAGFVLPISILANIRNFCFFLHRNEFFDSLALLEDDIFQPLDSDEIFMANRMIKQYSLFKTVLYSSSILPSFGCPISRILFGIGKFCQTIKIPHFLFLDIIDIYT